MIERAAKCNLMIVDNLGDGNCLFDAVADQVQRSKSKHSSEELRSIAVHDLKEKPYLVSLICFTFPSLAIIFF